jgi:preprotein translocase subunit Sss1
MSLGIPMAAMYTFFRVRKLRSEERMAAIARGAEIPMQPELSEAARSRRSGILLVAGAIGYIATFALIGRVEPDAMIAATFGIIPLAVGIGFFVDHALIRRDAKAL